VRRVFGWETDMVRCADAVVGLRLARLRWKAAQEALEALLLAIVRGLHRVVALPVDDPAAAWRHGEEAVLGSSGA
jgi:hypothetical protein